MRVLIGLECSGIIREAFRRRGHDAWSCDLKPSETPGNHIQRDIFDVLDDGWDLLIGHPVCTFNAHSSSKWRWHPEDKNLPIQLRRPHPLYPDRRQKQQEAIDFFKKMYNCGIPKICLENPKPLHSLVAQVGKYRQIVQPWMFGDPFTKPTYLWLKGLPMLKPTNIVDKGEFITTKSGKRLPKWYSDAKSGNKTKTQTERSRTFPGMASAMAAQWG